MPIIQAISDWSKAPFSSGMSVWGWFLFFGLLIVISILWSRILREAGHLGV